MADGDDLARAVHALRMAGLERRYCTAEAPMPQEDIDRFMWGHGDAVVVIPDFLGLLVCRCPHCGLTFTCFPPPRNG